MAELELKHRILDNLHGFVYLTDLERELVNTPQFQRLRHIKQLGVADLVFPGAQHTRFSHSLGVLNLTERVFWNLKRKLPESGYNPHRLEVDRKKLRIAALLHDIGHYPLSHTLESAYQKYAKFESEQINKDINKEEIELPKKSDVTEDDMHHEHISEHLIKESNEIRELLVNNGFSKQEIEDIFNTITGDSQNTELFYTQLMHSDLDVDSLDYCLRDSHGAGIEYGKYDINYLLDSIELRKKTGKYILCFKEKAIHTIEHFLLAKHFYYLQVLFHPKRLFFEEAAMRFALEAIKNGWLPKPQEYRDLIIQPENCILFTDELFWGLLKKAINNESFGFLNGEWEKPSPEMRIFAKILLERKTPEQYYRKEVRREKGGKEGEDITDKMKEEATKGHNDKEPFTYSDITFSKHEITDDVFGRFNNTFDVSKTTDEYRYSLRKRLSDKGMVFNEDHFMVESRDSIRILEDSGNIVFLSDREESLAYMLARNKIGVYIHFD